jgi:two-component system response regulator HydG
MLRSPDESLVAAVKDIIYSIGRIKLQIARSEEILRRVGQEEPTVVLFHVSNPADGDDATALLRILETHRGKTAALIVSDEDNPELELSLLRLGAADYLTRPLNLGRLSYLVEKHTLEARMSRPQHRSAQRKGIEVVGEQDPFFHDASAATSQLMAQIRAIAPQDATVLLGGETGTGKTRIARLIHELSPRHKEPFLTVNCGCLSETLIASEMFGHVRGAFTGADRERTGKFAEVGSGTLLLDDIDALQLSLQPQLLRVLEERVFEPIGSNQSQPLRARLVVASNRPLEQEVAAGRFRSDLFYRLSVIGLFMPPLRECRGIVPQLASKFIAQFATANARPIRNITPTALNALHAYEWPGNVRELRNVIERAVALCPRDPIDLDDLPDFILAAVADSPGDGDVASGEATAPLALSKWEAESLCITQALEQHDFNRVRAAEALGISRMTLYRKLQKYGLVDPIEAPPGAGVRPRRKS